MRKKEIVLEKQGVGYVEKILFTIRPMAGNIRHDVWLEPVEKNKVQNFLQNLPKKRGYVFISREKWPVQLAKDLFQLKEEVDKFYIYEAHPETFQPQTKFPVVRINLNLLEHQEAVERCEHKTALQDELCDGCEAFAIILRGKVASYATYRVQSPMGSLITGVWTNPKRRGKGYGKAVVSGATTELLKKSKHCCYEVLATNLQSIQVCKSLKYQLVGKRYQCGKYDGLAPKKTEMKITIRPMSIEDIPIVAMLIAECCKFLAERQKFSSVQIENLLKERCSEKHIKKLYKEFLCYVVEMEGNIAGVIEIEGNNIAELWVSPQYHRQGIRKKLFEKAEQVIIEGGYNLMTVHTTGYATPFYETMGMHVAGKKLCEYGPLKGWTLTCLEKSIKEQN